MNRHDPLSSLGPAATEPDPPPLPAPKARKKPDRPKLPALLREVAAVSDDTLAFLYGGADQHPGDYERNVGRAAEIRAEFTAYCEQHPHYANWRQAWAAFRASAERKVIPVDFEPLPGPTAPTPQPVHASAPLWQQRCRHRAARLFRRET
ncbi:MAG TPA: hypothetical protein VMU04_23240 [Candidatus Acidoferrum sp.]|nr:hypothetical protein [Candidatus Acidoferrum sp.]